MWTNVNSLASAIIGCSCSRQSSLNPTDRGRAAGQDSKLELLKVLASLHLCREEKPFHTPHPFKGQLTAECDSTDLRATTLLLIQRQMQSTSCPSLCGKASSEQETGSAWPGDCPPCFSLLHGTDGDREETARQLGYLPEAEPPTAQQKTFFQT